MAKVTMPQLGESVAEGTIGKWLKQPGDTVAKYEPLLEVITDKVNAEVPSPFAGVLKEILVEEGATVPNNAEIAVIETAEEAGGNGTAPADAGPAEAGRRCRAGRSGGASEPEAPASGPAGSDESGPEEQKPAEPEKAAGPPPPPQPKRPHRPARPPPHPLHPTGRPPPPRRPHRASPPQRPRGMPAPG